MPYADYLVKTSPPWLQDQWGAAWLGGVGSTLDDYLAEIIDGTLATFPEYAPGDALGVLGEETGIIQGVDELNDSYAVRLRSAWLYWKLAGTPVSLLVALYWAGFPGAVLVQQNGLAYELSGAPVAGEDPRPLLVITPTAELAAALTSTRRPPRWGDPGRSIPAGTSWWLFDSDTDHTSRFAILFPTLPARWRTWGVATFTGTEDGTPANPWPLASWNNAFTDTNYCVYPSVPAIIDGPSTVIISGDGTSKTHDSIGIVASASFVGTVDVLAWQRGANPFADLHPQDADRLRRTIRAWRPGKAHCEGVYTVVRGKMMGWPPQTQATNTMGPSIIARIDGA